MNTLFVILTKEFKKENKNTQANTTPYPKATLGPLRRNANRLNAHLCHVRLFTLLNRTVYLFHHVRQPHVLETSRPAQVVAEIALHDVHAVLDSVLGVVGKTLLADGDADDGGPGGQFGGGVAVGFWAGGREFAVEEGGVDVLRGGLAHDCCAAGAFDARPGDDVADAKVVGCVGDGGLEGERLLDLYLLVVVEARRRENVCCWLPLSSRVDDKVGGEDCVVGEGHGELSIGERGNGCSVVEDNVYAFFFQENLHPLFEFRGQRLRGQDFGAGMDKCDADVRVVFLDLAGELDAHGAATNDHYFSPSVLACISAGDFLNKGFGVSEVFLVASAFWYSRPVSFQPCCHDKIVICILLFVAIAVAPFCHFRLGIDVCHTPVFEM